MMIGNWNFGLGGAVWLLLTAIAAPAQTTAALGLTPVADTSIFGESENSNARGALFAGRTLGKQGTTFRRALLRFDLSDLPTSATIESVELTLTVTRVFSSGEPMSLHRVTAPWGEGQSSSELGLGDEPTTGDATWTFRVWPDVEWTVAGGDYVSSPSATTTVPFSGEVTWSGPALLADVLAWSGDDGEATNHGWILIGDEATLGSAKRFASREDPDQAPRLRVIYQRPEGPPSSAWKVY